MSRFFRAASDSDSDSSDDNSDVEDKKTTTAAGGTGGGENALRSRFARGAKDSDDSNDSDDNSDNDSDEADSDDDNGGGKRKFGAAQFKRGAGSDDSSDDEEDDGKRQVRSARDKRFEEMRAIVKVLANAKKINDWVAIQNEFDKLNKTYTKAATTIQKEGHQRFYIRALAQLEDHVKSVSDNKDTQKKMNPSTARAFNAMKQKIKKHNKLYEENINGWRENPVNEEDSEAEEAEAIAKLAREKEESSEEERDQDEEAELKSDEEAADTFTMVGKKGKAIDMENLYKALKDLIEARGKKNTDKLALISMLRRLYEGATTNAFQKVRVLLVLIPAQFDYTPPITGFMSTDMWKHALNDINTLLTLLDANRHFSVVDFVEEDLPEVEIEKKAEAKEPTPFQGNIPSYVERLDDEFTKSLQNIDPHTMEYIDRLKDETALYALIIRAQRYQERTRSGDFDAVAPTLMRRLEHLYYKPDQVVRTVEAAVKALPGWKDSGSDDPNTLVTDLCVRLYQSQNDRIRIRTLLCHVYHHALHDRFHQARDMMLMSHMQENINSADIQTQIMYNRTMVQLGLCAFRCGLIRDAQAALQEIQSSNRVKELLAQGFQMQRFSEKTPEQEKLEKQRQLPFHMHINLELLECVYFTCSMLLEIPNMAMNAHDSRRKVISRMFRKMLEYNERQIFNGPPENTRDHIMAASKALSQGEWQQCRDLIYVIKIWDLMPNAAAIKEMLGRKIQEEGLRTYFFAFSRHYDSLGLEQLASMFDLPVSTVYSLVAKMIHNEELHASLDQPTNTVVLHRPGPGAEMSRLEYLAGAFPDKVATFVESNERLLEARSITLGLQQAQTREGVQSGGGRSQGYQRREGQQGGGRGGGRGGFGGKGGRGRGR